MLRHSKMALNEVHLVRGQTKILNVKVRTGEGRKVSLVDASLTMSVYRQPGEVPVVVKRTGDGISVIDQASGDFQVRLECTDTQLIEVGVWLYDIWMEFGERDPVERYPVVQLSRLRSTDSATSFG